MTRFDPYFQRSQSWSFLGGINKIDNVCWIDIFYPLACIIKNFLDG
jgi:hypothetical protein